MQSVVVFFDYIFRCHNSSRNTVLKRSGIWGAFVTGGNKSISLTEQLIHSPFYCQRHCMFSDSCSRKVFFGVILFLYNMKGSNLPIPCLPPTPPHPKKKQMFLVLISHSLVFFSCPILSVCKRFPKAWRWVGGRGCQVTKLIQT